MSAWLAVETWEGSAGLQIPKLTGNKKEVGEFYLFDGLDKISQ